MICYSDGGYRNDGLYGSNSSGYGSFLIEFNNSTTQLETFNLLEADSNNAAEYMSLIKLLEWLKKNNIKENIIIYMDSQLVVNQVNGLWKINYKRLQELKNVVDSFKINFELKWVGRNKIVEKLGH